MVEPLRHRRTKEAATDMFSLQPPRHISTLPKAVRLDRACLALLLQRPAGINAILTEVPTMFGNWALEFSSPNPSQNWCRRDSRIGTLWNIGAAATALSSRLDIGCPHHLAPLISFICDKCSQFGGRPEEGRHAHVSEPHLHVGTAKNGVDLLVEPLDDFGGRAIPQTYCVPLDRLIAGYEIANGRNFRQHLQSRRASHRQSA